MHDNKTKNSSIRLSDIAKKANVSRITVSKALLGTGGKNVRISEATRDKILKIAKSMNYKPNMAARMLAGKKSKLIGAIIDSHAPLCLYECLRMMERKLAKKGYRFMIAQQHDDQGSIIEFIDDFSTYGVEAVICFAHSYPDFKDNLKKILQIQPNIVYIGKPELENCNYLEIDIKDGIKQVITHLVKRNKKRIGIFLVDKKSRTMNLRYNGYLEGLKEHNIKLDKNLIISDEKFRYPSAENVSEIIQVLVKKEKVDAIVALNDNFAARIINQLSKEKYSIPADIAVTGFDNMDFSEFFPTSITTVNHQYDILAEVSINMLLGLIENQQNVSQRVIKPELIIRESS